jgi:hypothetical protein
MAIKLILNKKLIWDNTEFAAIIRDNRLSNPSSYLPPKYINDEFVSIGGWNINIKSTIHRTARPDDIIKGFEKMSSKLGLNIQRLFLPFFVGDLLEYSPNAQEQKKRGAYEPLIVMFLRLCFWYEKCDLIGPSLTKKNKEIRNKLKVSDPFVNILKSRNGYAHRLKEWVRQAIGVVYELINASLSHDCIQSVSFDKKHDFIFKNNPAEVKTKFPPIDTRLGEEFYPFLNARLKDSHMDLEYILNESIKVPEILENNLKPAIERQDGRIIFLNLILENQSSILRYLSEYKRNDLTIQTALHRAIELLTDESNVPIIISFHAVHCNYEIYSVTTSIPIKRENGKATIIIEC